jgi:hypothetical protein
MGNWSVSSRSLATDGEGAIVSASLRPRTLAVRKWLAKDSATDSVNSLLQDDRFAARAALRITRLHL